MRLILSAADLGPDEGFFIGEINNKDNPDYHPPFDVEVINTIPEKETALILDVNALQPDHMIRIQKQVSAASTKSGLRARTRNRLPVAAKSKPRSPPRPSMLVTKSVGPFCW